MYDRLRIMRHRVYDDKLYRTSQTALTSIKGARACPERQPTQRIGLKRRVAPLPHRTHPVSRHRSFDFQGNLHGVGGL